MLLETKEIKRLVDIGETFSVYEVLIKPDEMIRGEGKRINKQEVEEDYKGRKEDGEEFIENGMLERVYHYLSEKKLHTFSAIGT